MAERKKGTPNSRGNIAQISKAVQKKATLFTGLEGVGRRETKGERNTLNSSKRYYSSKQAIYKKKKKKSKIAQTCKQATHGKDEKRIITARPHHIHEYSCSRETEERNKIISQTASISEVSKSLSCDIHNAIIHTQQNNSHVLWASIDNTKKKCGSN